MKWLCNITKQVESGKRYSLRDFTYVAKGEYWTTRIYKCYVFRYENTLAQTTANTWHDICRNLMIECGLRNTAAELSNNGFVYI